MRPLLGRYLVHDPPGTPAPRRLLDGAHVEDPVVQVLHHLAVGLPPQERPVAVHAVAGEQALLPLRDEPRHVLVERVCRLLGGRGGGQDRGREARVSVCHGAPVVHLVETGLGQVDDGVEPFLVEDLKITRRDDAVYLYDFIIVLIESSHLENV